ncbi:hypothetical protein ACX801_04300 [Arthrobacter bambusae]
MVLDNPSLRFALGVAAVALCLRFFGSFRRARSAYSGWWRLAPVFFLAGNVAFLLTGTSRQAWADPAGNALQPSWNSQARKSTV